MSSAPYKMAAVVDAVHVPTAGQSQGTATPSSSIAQSTNCSYLLSPLQRGMLAEQLSTGYYGYDLEQYVFRLGQRPNFSPETMNIAWLHVSRAHSALRALITMENGQGFFTAQKSVEPEFKVISLQEAKNKDPELFLHNYLDQDRARGIELLNNPCLWRVAYLDMGAGEWIMVATVHHAIIDGRSKAPLYGDLFSSYEALANKSTAPQLTESRYEDFLHAIRDIDEEAAKDHWAELFKEHQQADKITDPSISAERSHQRIDHTVLFSEQEKEQILSLLRDKDYTLNTIYQLAWSILCSRLTRNSNVCFGSIRNGRHWKGSDPETRKRGVGLFMCNPPVRFEVDESSTISDSLLSLRQQSIDVRAYEQVDLRDLMRWVEATAGSTLFESFLMMEVGNWSDQILQELPENWQNVQLEIEETSFVPFCFTLFQRPDKMELTASYDPGQYSAEFVETATQSMRHLIMQLATQPENTLSQVSLFSPTKKDLQILSGTQRTLPHNTLHQCFSETAKTHPDKIALTDNNGGISKSYSYVEIDQLSNDIAQRLIDKGLKTGQIAGILTERGASEILYLIGILKAGGCYLAIDPEQPAARMKEMIEDADMGMLLANPDSDYSIEELSLSIPILNIDIKTLNKKSDPPELEQPPQRSFATFSSGSTGRPKGVVNYHRSTLNHILACIKDWEISPTDAVGHTGQITFDVAVEEIWIALLSGGRLVIPDGDIIRRSLHEYINWLNEEKITILDITTLYGNSIVNYLKSHPSETPFSARLMVVGGETAPLHLWRGCLEVWGDDFKMLNSYGPSEASIAPLMFYCWGEDMSERQEIPIGRPIENVSAYITDPAGKLCPPGVIGEICLGGICPGEGYLSRAELTREKFIRNPFSIEEQATIYRTGDLGFYDQDGLFYFRGRADRQLKIRGMRIEPGELENRLLSDSEVKEAYVKIVDKDKESARLIAYVCGVNGDCNIEALKNRIRETLPEYLMPRQILLLDQLPKTARGKVDESKLPDDKQENEEGSFVEPRDELEKAIHGAWSTVLKRGDFGIHDEFYSIGGDSLMALEIVMLLEKERLSLSGQDFAGGATIDKLASTARNRLHGQADSDQWKPLIKLKEGDEKREPWIFFHVGSGDLAVYRHLIDEIGLKCPCYGVISKGLHDFQLAHESINEMAGEYAEAILSSDIPEPYNLVGYCIGGNIAFEVAAQLRKKGAKIGEVVLIESAPTKKGGQLNKKFQQKLSLWKRIAQAGSKEVAVRLLQKNKKLFNLVQRLRGKADAQLDVRSWQERFAYYVDRNPLYASNIRALQNHRSSYYPEKIHLILSPDISVRDPLDKNGGWESYAQNIKLHHLPEADHFSIIEKPENAQRLATEMESIILNN